MGLAVIPELVQTYSGLIRPNQKLFLSVAIPWFLLTVVFWPGMFVEDFFAVVSKTQEFRGNSWHSYPWSAFVMTVGQLDPSYFLMSLICLGLYLSLLLRVLARAHSLTAPQRGLFLVLNLMPCLFMFFVFTYRDVLQSLLFAHLLLHLSDLWSTKEATTRLINTSKEIRKTHEGTFFLEALVLAVFIIQLKIDSLVAMGAVISLCLVQSIVRQQMRRLLITLGACVVIGILRWSSPVLPVYEMTGILNNLAVVLIKGKPLEYSDEKIISEFINIDLIKKQGIESSIDDYLQGSMFSEDLSSEELIQHWKVFRAKAVELSIKNWLVIFDYRLKTLIQALNFRRDSYIWQDRYSSIPSGLGSSSDSVIADIIETLSPLRTSIIERANILKEKPLLGEIFFSYAVYILSMLMMFFYARKDAFIWILGGLILLRVLPVIFTMPSPMFKYYGGLLFPVIAWVMLGFSKKPSEDL